MDSPGDRRTPPDPPDFGVEQNDANELEHTDPSAHANGKVDPSDMDALITAFLKLPFEEQTKRLLHLYLAIQGEDGLTRKDLANHIVEDRQEFEVINYELCHLTRCVESIAAHFEITLPPEPKERPRRRE